MAYPAGGAAAYGARLDGERPADLECAAEGGFESSLALVDFLKFGIDRGVGVEVEVKGVGLECGFDAVDGGG